MSELFPFFPIVVAVIGFAGLFVGIYIDRRLAKRREASARTARTD